MEMTNKEKWSFAIGGAGQNMVNTLVGSFILTYMTASAMDGGAGLTAAGVAAFGTFMTLEKIWDAINDSLMGVLVDRTHTKYGKLRPYILITALPIAILTILMFNVNIFKGDVGKLVFFGIVYIIWEAFYTLCDVPFWGLAARITNKQSERTKVIALTRIIQIFGAVAAFAIGTYGPSVLGGSSDGTNTQLGYSLSSVIVAVIGMGLFTLAFFNTKEKNEEKVEEAIKLKEVIRTAVNCKPLLINLLGAIVSFGRSMITVVGSAFIINIIERKDLTLYVLAAMMVGTLIANLYTPYIINKIGTRNLMTSTGFLSAILYIVLYFVGYKSTIPFIIMVFLVGVTGGMFLLGQTEMIAEAVDDIRAREGVNREGVCFSGLTFSGKITNALSTLAYTIIMVIVAGVSNEEEVIVTVELTNALWAGIALLPAICSLLASLVYSFYPIKKPFKFK